MNSWASSAGCCEQVISLNSGERSKTKLPVSPAGRDLTGGSHTFRWLRERQRKCGRLSLRAAAGFCRKSPKCFTTSSRSTVAFLLAKLGELRRLFHSSVETITYLKLRSCLLSFPSSHSASSSPYLTKWSPKRTAWDSISVCAPLLSDDPSHYPAKLGNMVAASFSELPSTATLTQNMVPHSSEHNTLPKHKDKHTLVWLNSSG